MLAFLLLGSKALTPPGDLKSCAMSKSKYAYTSCKFTKKDSTSASTYGDRGDKNRVSLTLEWCYFGNYNAYKETYASICRLKNGEIQVSYTKFESCNGNGASCIYIEHESQSEKSVGQFDYCEFTACTSNTKSAEKVGYKDAGLYGNNFAYGCVGCFGLATFTHCNFTGNKHGGLTVAGTGELTIQYCAFEDNTVFWNKIVDGGDLSVGQKAVLRASNCTFENSGKGQGRSLTCNGGQVSLSDCSLSFSSKTSLGDPESTGSTVYFTEVPTAFTLSGCSFEGECVHFAALDTIQSITLRVLDCIDFSNSEAAARAPQITFEDGSVQYNGQGCEPAASEVSEVSVSPDEQTIYVDPSEPGTSNDAHEASDNPDPSPRIITDDDEGSKGNKLGPGPIAAIVIVVILVIVVIVVLLIIFLSKRRYLKTDSFSATNTEQEVTDTVTEEPSTGAAVTGTGNPDFGLWDSEAPVENGMVGLDEE